MTVNSEGHDAIDRIYEAAIVPDRWPDICDLLAERSDSYSGTIVAIHTDGDLNWISSPHVEQLMADIAASPLRLSSERPQRHLARSPYAFLRDIDLMSDDELAEDVIYNQFLRPIGLGWTAGDIIQEPTGHTIVFDIIRQSAKGPFTLADIDRLNALRPHLARAVLMASRLSFQEATNMTRVLSSVGLPCAVVRASGAVIVMNPEMEMLSPRLEISGGDRLRVANFRSNALLQQTMSELTAGLRPAHQSIPVPPEGSAPALILHVLPIAGDARDIFSRGVAIVVACKVGDNQPPDIQLISGLFDLTGAEARVARAIASGRSVDETARDAGSSRETVRSQLKRIFSKTGVSSQAQLAALLSNTVRTRAD